MGTEVAGMGRGRGQWVPCGVGMGTNVCPRVTLYTFGLSIGGALEMTGVVVILIATAADNPRLTHD